ncbi:hypothetical protein [Paracidovorax citrulli]
MMRPRGDRAARPTAVIASSASLAARMRASAPVPPDVSSGVSSDVFI